MDGGAWWAAVHGVAKIRTRLSNFTFTFYFHALEKDTSTHSSVLAWRIPGTGEPGGLPSMGSHRVRHDWSDLAAAESPYTSTTYSNLLQRYWAAYTVCNSECSQFEEATFIGKPLHWTHNKMLHEPDQPQGRYLGLCPWRLLKTI